MTLNCFGSFKCSIASCTGKTHRDWFPLNIVYAAVRVFHHRAHLMLILPVLVELAFLREGEMADDAFNHGHVFKEFTK
jgi:hypothetical protein